MKENSTSEEAVFKIYPDEDPQTGSRWYAVYTRPRHEKKVYSLLKEKEINSYLPLIRECHIWSDRKKWVEEPLIRGYVFVRIPLTKSLYVLETEGIIRFVMFNKKYASIPDFQIEALQRTLSSGYSLEPSKYLKVGQLVEVIDGPLKGVIGEIQRIQSQNRFVISLDAVQMSFSIQINPSLLQPVTKGKKISLPLGFE